MHASARFFLGRYNITEHDLERYLDTALDAGGDYADLYFEYQATTALSVDESMVKSATEGVTVGCGVRVIHGERTGYAYTDDLSPQKIAQAARLAACIARGPARAHTVGLTGYDLPRNLYPLAAVPTDAALAEKLELALRADRAARAADPRICQVRVGYSDEVRHVMIATSDGRLAADHQPLTRLAVSAQARNGKLITQGFSGGGGRVALDFFHTQKPPERFAAEAARQAVVQLTAEEAPAGEMTVVLGPGWPGILLHEAIGHGLEADFNRKKVSAFSGLMGRRVASDLCTVVDDGTIPNRRGSLNMDDEGSPSQQTVLIEKGILKGYLQDKLSARLMRASLTGNGRRESYSEMPMPRMTNTYLLAGQDAPEDIIRGVDRGLYAANFGGGQVDIVSGRFVFSASEAYLIENGRITRPVRNATLIGNGPEALTRVSAVGADLALDEGVGTCSKEGQTVPVGVGIPTLRIDGMTVGGTR
jgi:TldD protein